MKKYSYDDIAVAILTFTFCVAPIAVVIFVLFAGS